MVLLAAGCAAPQIRPDISSFPPPPATARVVHLKSFNALNDLIPRRVGMLDALRGRTVSPRVGTPGGIDYENGRLYVCDTDDNVVHVWDLATGHTRRIGQTDDARLAKPVDVAVDERGNVYVADTARAEVVRYMADGSIRRYRPPGRENYRPVAVAVAEERLFVTDIAGHRLDVFTTEDGAHVASIGGIGTDPGRFYFPMGVAVDGSGKVYVADMMNGRVQTLDADLNVMGTFGRPGNRYGDLGKPRHLTVGPDGVIFIADVEFRRVHLFNRDGQLLMLLGRSLGPSDAADPRTSRSNAPAERPTGVPHELLPGATPMPVSVAVTESTPAPLTALVLPTFEAHYFLFVSNSLGPKRLSVFAIGEDRPGTTAPPRGPSAGP